MVSHPGAVLFDAKNWVICQPCRPSNGLTHSLLSGGISAQLGEQTRPSVALLDRHIRWMDKDLDHQYCSAHTPLFQRKYALAGFGLLTFWLAWLQSMEAFGLRWHDLSTIEPADGASADLPYGWGAVTYTFGPESKSTRIQRVDVPVVY
jgi:hypothetical protein